MMEKLITWVAVILLIPAMILMVGFIVVAPIFLAWKYFHPPQSIELEVKEWECVSTYKERVFNGKVWLIITKCADYSRKGINK
jgi:ABC-type sugar transport system permease subunit